MLNDLFAEVGVEIWPVKVARGGLLNIQDLPHWRILEPREIVIGQEIFRVIGEQPDAVAGDVGDLNLRRRHPMHR